MIKTNLNTQSGRSMIEMLGVLAIVGVLSVGGIAGYSKAMTKFKINKTADQISQIVTNIRTLYAQQTTYQGLDGKTAHQMGVIPDELGSPNNDYFSSFTNAFGSKTQVFSEKKFENGGWNEAFVVMIDDLPKEACGSLATMDWGTSSSSGFIGMIVGNASTPVPVYADKCTDPGWGDVHCSKDGPMNVAAAANACKCDYDDCGISITWKFY